MADGRRDVFVSPGNGGCPERWSTCFSVSGYQGAETLQGSCSVPLKITSVDGSRVGWQSRAPRR